MTLQFLQERARENGKFSKEIAWVLLENTKHLIRMMHHADKKQGQNTLGAMCCTAMFHQDFTKHEFEGLENHWVVRIMQMWTRSVKLNGIWIFKAQELAESKTSTTAAN
jgi:hypothetical protein